MLVPRNVVLVAGTHDTGKTTIIEGLLSRVTSKYVVAVIKDIHIDNFSIDSPGKDTWRHADAGARIVCARGPGETSFITRTALDLERIIATVEPEVDMIIAEGFKEHHGKKVIAARDAADLAAIKATCNEEDEVLAVGGVLLANENIVIDCQDCIVLRDDAAFDALVEKLEPVAKLGRLRRNRLRMPLEALDCTLTINETPITMKPYVAETLKNIVVGSIAALHWNLQEPVSRIEAKFDRETPLGDASLASTLHVTINGKVLTLKEFVRDSIGDAVLAYAGTLSLPGGSPISGAMSVRVLLCLPRDT